jgi:hypothetical protein
MMRIWKETWYGDKQKYWNQAKCELKKGSLSPTLLRSHKLEVFIHRKVASWGVPKWIPRFVNGGPCMHYPE